MTPSHKRDTIPGILLLLFPLAEIATFIAIGRVIGILPTLLLVLASSTVGFVILRDIGLQAVLTLSRGQSNALTALAKTGPRICAGILFLIPGFLTDLLAILFLLPQIQIPVLGRFFTTDDVRPNQAPRKTQAAETQVIDGEYRRIDDRR